MLSGIESGVEMSKRLSLQDPVLVPVDFSNPTKALVRADFIEAIVDVFNKSFLVSKVLQLNIWFHISKHILSCIQVWGIRW